MKLKEISGTGKFCRANKNTKILVFLTQQYFFEYISIILRNTTF